MRDIENFQDEQVIHQDVTEVEEVKLNEIRLVNTEVKNDLHILFNNAPNNLLNTEFLDAIEASCELAQKKGARGILFLSKLKHFSGGADPDFFEKTDPSDRDPMRLIKLIESVAVPTVVGINGVAVGGGFELALGCDLIVASKSASIGLVEVSVGLMPLSGGVQRVVQRAGLVRGKERDAGSSLRSKHT